MSDARVCFYLSFLPLRLSCDRFVVRGASSDDTPKNWIRLLSDLPKFFHALFYGYDGHRVFCASETSLDVGAKTVQNRVLTFCDLGKKHTHILTAPMLE